jgi:putative transposase
MHGCEWIRNIESGGVLREGVAVTYAWIERHRSAYPVELMCQSLGVSKSGWYAARAPAQSQRDEENARLVTRMHSLQQRHRGRYGRRRMHRALREEVGVINEKRVGRLMRQHGLQAGCVDAFGL